MLLVPGARIGPYEIVGQIGAGGMGVVYRAIDTNLKRQVAIKTLPASVADDRDRLQRFQREAEILAAFNHPNIAHVHGLERTDGTVAIVMELVEGPTLTERLARGPLAIDEAMRIADGIAEALEAAHEQRIVHRDLKPANIKVRPDGSVKVLDFGLAKAVTADVAAPDLTQSPTLTVAGTREGVIVGTASYMSPEQAKGLNVDRRTDLFAFGIVLFEMLAGRPPFLGETVGDILAAIIRAEPDWSALPADIPQALHRLLRRCLQKDRARRLDSAAAARLELAEAQSEPSAQVSGSEVGRPSSSSRLAWSTAAVLAAIAVLLAGPAFRYFRETTPASVESRLEASTPSTPLPLHFALSPDGRSLVFVAAGDGPTRLWLRTLQNPDAQPLPDTDGAEYPFWSADGRSVGFFATDRLYRLDLTGGSPQPLALAASGTGASWNADGTILFTPNVAADRLYRIPSAGGERIAVTRNDLAGAGVAHHFPTFLPDQRRFLFYATGGPEVRGIYLASLDGGEPKRLIAADTYGGFLPPDRVLFVSDGALVATQLDLDRGELTGKPVTLAKNVGYDPGTGWGGFSVSRAGTVAYRTGLPRRQLAWYDRTGARIGLVGEPDANDLTGPALSPDGRRVALGRNVRNGHDIWIMDLLRGGLSPFTSEAETEIHPVWSPDGASIVFESSRDAWKMRIKPSSGVGADAVVHAERDLQRPQDWSRDGKFLVYDKLTSATGHDVWFLERTGNEWTPKAFVATAAEELNAQFSPDGRWIAYETNASGRYQVVVQSFPNQTRSWPVSIDGGAQPRWSADGRELYFVAPDRKMMAVPVVATRTTFEVGAPVALFATHIVSSRLLGLHAQYVVARDGRFLINETADEFTAPITVILNWDEGRAAR